MICRCQRPVERPGGSCQLCPGPAVGGLESHLQRPRLPADPVSSGCQGSGLRAVLPQGAPSCPHLSCWLHRGVSAPLPRHLPVSAAGSSASPKPGCQPGSPPRPPGSASCCLCLLWRQPLIALRPVAGWPWAVGPARRREWGCAWALWRPGLCSAAGPVGGTLDLWARETRRLLAGAHVFLEGISK